jgi:hypothetical protein
MQRMYTYATESWNVEYMMEIIGISVWKYPLVCSAADYQIC